jgi:hypothetical protein
LLLQYSSQCSRHHGSHFEQHKVAFEVGAGKDDDNSTTATISVGGNEDEKIDVDVIDIVGDSKYASGHTPEREDLP